MAFLMVLTYALGAVGGFKPTNLSVGEFFTNPIGYSLDDLSFSWQIPALHQGIRQSAYQIAVADTPENLEAKPIFDSGKVESSDSVNVPYKGKKPNSRQRLYWRVRVWDETGKMSDWSDPAFFEAGLLSNSDWSGKWIFTPEPLRKMGDVDLNLPGRKRSFERLGVPPAYMRKEFEAKSGIKSARLYVASRGIFRISINGRKVGNDFWGTGWTDYYKRIQTNTYDVTKLVWEGSDNALGAIIADGWYSGRMTWHMSKGNYGGQKPELLAQLEIEYEDGSRQTVSTDSTWKASFGPIVDSDIYDGERYDSRLEMDDWDRTGFDDSEWKSAAEKPVEDMPLLEPRRNQPIVEKDVLYPVSVKKVSDGTFIFDLGQNMVGWARIKIPSVPGREIKIRFAEMLNKDGTMYTENYRSAKSTDYYICSSHGVEEWEPNFTFHGFRYVELSGFPENTKATTDWVRGIVLYNDMPDAGTFVCSNPNLNLLQNCVYWGQRSNLFSVPTDCPQRDERLGWTGDAQVFCPTAAYNMDTAAFYTKWMFDVRDSQRADGNVAMICPLVYNTHVNGKPVSDMTANWYNASAAWSDAMVIIPWDIYLAYGNDKILRQNYDAMKKWVDFQKATSDNLIRPNVGFGDWLQVGRKPGNSVAPKSVIGTAYFVRTCDILSKTAKLLGRDGDAKTYSELAKSVRGAFVEKFVKPDGTIMSDCQTVYLLALAFDILPEHLRQKSFSKLVDAVERVGRHLDTGFVGTPLVCEVLTRFGRHDLACAVVQQEDYPSWIYPITQGATTMWERWNSYTHKDGFGDVNMNSFNHYAYGAIGQWMYRHLGGLWLDESKPGYKNIIFAPKPEGGINFASTSHITPYGTAMSSWKISDGVMEWKVVIPPNSTGTLEFPTDNPKLIRVNGHVVPSGTLENVNGVPTIREMPSGTYSILLKAKKQK